MASAQSNGPSSSSKAKPCGSATGNTAYCSHASSSTSPATESSYVREEDTWLDLASAHGTPVYITVWDLLPESRWSSLSRTYLGVGVFHTNVWLPDLECEYAFGGHDVPGVTGVFALPCRGIKYGLRSEGESKQAHALPRAEGAVNDNGDKEKRLTMQAISHSSCKPLKTQEGELIDGLTHRYARPKEVPAPGPPPFPGCRYLGAYFMGYSAAPSFQRASDPSSASSAAAEDTAKKIRFGRGTLLEGMGENGKWVAPTSGAAAFKEPDIFVPPTLRRRASQAAAAVSAAKRSGWLPSFLDLHYSSSASSASSRSNTPAPFAHPSYVTMPTSTSTSRPPSSVSTHAPDMPPQDSTHPRPLPRHPRRSALRARSLLHVHQSLAFLKSSSLFHGLSYDLLTNNCNHFTETFLELLLRPDSPLSTSTSPSSPETHPPPLLPAWINRAAWLGAEAQRLVPLETLERAVFKVAGVENTDAPGASAAWIESGDHQGEDETGCRSHDTRAGTTRTRDQHDHLAFQSQHVHSSLAQVAENLHKEERAAALHRA
ncbi:hypothetical protein K437DRAFT_257571 [Tilletiaria anomala UBC 951]|uniref:PPPDE domain-containing protein n=1 Tax=Tilletiaria anomala (strain ATCC 24038 / CBS 436.72 / UBC 951) TaxID=1037660 RepID=A0A066VSD5_TILAU|nr:uncharacterized protein K437DRAFT_257571 [Tilletiaria anomala UBC 951]KDN43198.1 hypothetical protein K437DRAFT_257571 [Tilletiaria anomala UBC 951]